MSKPFVDYTLYLVTGPYKRSEHDHYFHQIDEALRGGITLLQLREKKASSKRLFEIAGQLKTMADLYQVPLIINDRVDIALAMNAAGVHVGQDDLPAGTVRGLIGKEKILGVSASTVEEAVRAEKDGADYLGVGAMFPTKSKSDATSTSLETLEAIRRAVHIPIVAIGGITEANVDTLYSSGINGIAVISAILSQKDVLASTKQLRKKSNVFHEVKH
ncbi:thiamine phosphate synthase [Sporolactobacillus sp. THM7-4]|nr:thiamine phosphate synthase [Sporolactobacillus sp. THM7-4]